MKAFSLFVVLVFVSIFSKAQDKPGAEITNGNSVYENESVLPENVGLLKLKLNDEGLGGEGPGGESSLHMDQFDIQSVTDGEFGGILFFQDQGGCVNIATNGQTTVGYLSADSISIDGALQTQASGQIAYGTVNAAGNKTSGSTNWTVAYNASENRYEIDIAGEDYYFLNYSTIATSVGAGIPKIATTDSQSDKLIVKLYNLVGGVVTTGIFSFSVNKYQEGGFESDCGFSEGPIGIANSVNGHNRRASLKK